MNEELFDYVYDMMENDFKKQKEIEESELKDIKSAKKLSEKLKEQIDELSYQKNLVDRDILEKEKKLFEFSNTNLMTINFKKLKNAIDENNIDRLIQSYIDDLQVLLFGKINAKLMKVIPCNHNAQGCILEYLVEDHGIIEIYSPIPKRINLSNQHSFSGIYISVSIKEAENVTGKIFSSLRCSEIYNYIQQNFQKKGDKIDEQSKEND